MKIAVLCANGKAGKLIVGEAINKGLEVSAFVRDSTKARFDSKVCVVQKDIFTLESSDLQGFDVIIDAFGEWQNLSLHKAHMEHLVQILSGNSAKFLAVGGAGSLYMDKEHSVMFMDTPDFPQEYLPVARATAEAFDVIKVSKDINWVYVSPPAVFIPDAPKSGKYKIIGEEFEVNSKGESKISYADYAIAMIEIAIDSTYSKQRVGVIGL
ncbi:SDR family oxidoreductase [uncultured Helicobacter sp.]|uniref:SDR family oxidoreductase n=1 Tax=uncultured Helicobacter sp. TaxID=175537 RepID=UPI00374FBE54